MNENSVRSEHRHRQRVNDLDAARSKLASRGIQVRTGARTFARSPSSVIERKNEGGTSKVLVELGSR